MAKKMEYSLFTQVEVVPIPFVRQRGSGGVLLDAYRCNHCARVELSERQILIHLFVCHGIRRYKTDFKSVAG